MNDDELILLGATVTLTPGDFTPQRWTGKALTWEMPNTTSLITGVTIAYDAGGSLTEHLHKMVTPGDTVTVTGGWGLYPDGSADPRITNDTPVSEA